MKIINLDHTFLSIVSFKTLNTSPVISLSELVMHFLFLRALCVLDLAFLKNVLVYFFLKQGVSVAKLSILVIRRLCNISTPKLGLNAVSFFLTIENTLSASEFECGITSIANITLERIGKLFLSPNYTVSILIVTELSSCGISLI